MDSELRTKLAALAGELEAAREVAKDKWKESLDAHDDLSTGYYGGKMFLLEQFLKRLRALLTETSEPDAADG